MGFVCLSPNPGLLVPDSVVFFGRLRNVDLSGISYLPLTSFVGKVRCSLITTSVYAGKITCHFQIVEIICGVNVTQLLKRQINTHLSGIPTTRCCAGVAPAGDVTMTVKPLIKTNQLIGHYLIMIK